MSVVISATLLIFGAVAGRGRFLVNLPDGRYSLFAWVSDNVDIAAVLPSFFNPARAQAFEALVAAIWAVIGAAVVVALWAAGRRHARSWTVIVCSALAWIIGSSAATMALTRRPTTTHDRSQFAFSLHQRGHR